VYDLSVDPEALLNLDSEQIKARIFTRREDLPEGVDRIPIKAIHINKCPIVAPVNVVTDEVAERLGLDLPRCRAHLEKIKAVSGLAGKINKVFSGREFSNSVDPDQAIYSGGFFSSHDRQLMDELRTMSAEQLSSARPPFKDARLPEMLFRYRARNFPDTLSDEEHAQWQEFRSTCFNDETVGSNLTLHSYFNLLEEKLAIPGLSPEKRQLLIELQQYGQSLQTSLN